MLKNKNLLNRFKLDGKVALITGGTRGIGLATARALGDAGARLFISSRNDGEEVEKALGALGYDATFIAADLTDPQAPAALIADVLEQTGRARRSHQQCRCRLCTVIQQNSLTRIGSA